METDTGSEKFDVIIFGQKICSKLEHIPIKKRILLRDSAMYQCTPSSVEELNQQVDSSPTSQNSSLPGSPFVGNHSGPNSFSKHQADNLKSLRLNDNCRETVAKNIEGADSHPLFSGTQTPIDVIINNADKDAIADAVSVSRCNKGELSSVSLFPVANGDVISESTGAVLSLAGNVTADSYSSEKSALEHDDVACMDLEAVQPITLDNKIFWDLNVEMDAWEKPANPLNVESKSDPNTSDVQSDSNLEISVDYMLKPDTAVSENGTENYGHPMVECMNSDDICKQEQTTSDSSYDEQCGSVSVDQQVPFGSCHVEAHSSAKPSMEMASMTQSCNQELASKTNEHLTLRLDESTANFFKCAPRRDPGSVCATPNSSVVSTEEQNFDNKNIIIDGEGSVNFLHISDSEDNDLSKKWTDSKAGQHVVTLSSAADKLERGASARESDQFVTPEEKIIAETIKSASSTRELTETPLKRVDIETGNPLLSSFREECDVSIVQSVSTSSMCHQDAIATLVKEVPSMDKDCWAQIEQDYEDGELREMDMHCWDENETSIGEIECLDYEPEIEDIDDLDESQTSASVGKGETGFKSKKCELSETQLEKKLSGWDQLPKDGLSSSEKAHQKQGMFSRTLKSELRSCSDIPTLFEDAEDKETVVERRIRPKYMDDSYSAHCGSGVDKFNGKRRSTPHIHGRNRADNWDSERRSSINYQNIFDSHSGSRRVNIISKGREQYRSRSPYYRNEAYGPHTSYSGYSRGRNGSRVEGSGRSLRGARHGYKGSLADDPSESEFCMRPEFLRRERSFSPRPDAHFSGTFIRSRSGSRTRYPPLWAPQYEQLGPSVHHRSPEFSADDRVRRTRLPFWKSNHPPDSEMRCNSPPRVSRDTYSRGSFKSSEDFRATGYRGRMCPDTVMGGCIGGKDRRKHEERFEPGQGKQHYYKDSFVPRSDAEDNYHLKDDLSDCGETRNVKMRKKESKSHEKYEYDQLTYPSSTRNSKR